MVRLTQALWALDDVLRLHQVGFTAIWPLLGLAVVEGWSRTTVVSVVAVAVLFNTFGVVLNDIIDLPVDRSEPLRHRSPLVTGRLTRRQAAAIALTQLPLMVAAHLMGGLSPRALPLLGGVVLCMTVYDVWGKASRFPLALDAALGVSGGLFVLYGASVTGRPWPITVWPIALSAVVFLLFVNAYCNGLRDIENDRACGRCTTPIWFGCEGPVHGRIRVSASMLAYVAGLQALQLALAWTVAIEFAGLPDADPALNLAWLALASIVSVSLLSYAHRSLKAAWDVLMRVHLLSLPLPLLVACVPRLDPRAGVFLFALYLGVGVALSPLLVGERWRVPAARLDVVRRRRAVPP